jgi:TonB family protein
MRRNRVTNSQVETPNPPISITSPSSETPTAPPPSQANTDSQKSRSSNGTPAKSRSETTTTASDRQRAAIKLAREGVFLPPGGAAAPKKIAVSASVIAGNKLGGDTPMYPAIAKAARIQGTVVLQATSSKQGAIENLRVLSGPPMLQQAAMDAVRTWRYRPYLLNGQSLEVETQVNVIFVLGG